MVRRRVRSVGRGGSSRGAFAARAAEATPQQLATTARAFAKLGERRDALVDAVADALVAIVDGTNAAGAPPQKRGDADRTGDRTGGSGM